MALPLGVNSGSVDLHTVARWKTGDLQDATKSELQELLVRIKEAAFLNGTQPKKYWTYQPSKSGKKEELVSRIVEPNYKDGNKNTKTQAKVLKEARQCLLAGQHGNWVLRKGENGKEIEHWLFKKNVTNAHLPGGAGNPFTIFKIDSRKDACRDMWLSDVGIGRTKQDGERYLFFTRGFFGQFVDFEDHRPSQIHLSEEQVSHVKEMQIVKESDAEGFLFSILLHVAREDIYNLIGVENVNFDDVIVITGHRRQGESRQFEFDSIIAWKEEMVQHRNQCEIKTDTKRKPDWSGGFSKHQMQEAARKIEDDIVSKVRCVKSLYVRFEVDSEGNSWVARLDLYDTNGEFIKQLDIYNVPK